MSSPESIKGKVVFITGASSGIGAALAEEAAKRGVHAVLVARREAKLQGLAKRLSASGTQCAGLVADVNAGDQLHEAVRTTVERFGGIDITFANAGFAIKGTLEELGIDDYRRQLETNVFGVLRTIQATLPELKRRTGRLAAMGSVTGFLSLPGYSGYCMSKACVRSLCDCIRPELTDSGVSVTHVVPGFVESEIRASDGRGHVREDAEDPVPGFLVMPAPQAAREILDAVIGRQQEVIITRHAKAGVFLERHAHGVLSASVGLARSVIRRWSDRG